MLDARLLLPAALDAHFSLGDSAQVKTSLAINALCAPMFLPACAAMNELTQIERESCLSHSDSLYSTKALPRSPQAECDLIEMLFDGKR